MAQHTLRHGQVYFVPDRATHYDGKDYWRNEGERWWRWTGRDWQPHPDFLGFLRTPQPILDGEAS